MIDYKKYQKVLEIIDSDRVLIDKASAICELFDTPNIAIPSTGYINQRGLNIPNQVMNTQPGPVLCNDILEYPNKIISIKNQKIGGITVPVGLRFYLNGNYYRTLFDKTGRNILIDKKYGLDYDNFNTL